MLPVCMVSWLLPKMGKVFKLLGIYTIQYSRVGSRAQIFPLWESLSNRGAHRLTQADRCQDNFRFFTTFNQTKSVGRGVWREPLEKWDDSCRSASLFTPQRAFLLFLLALSLSSQRTSGAVRKLCSVLYYITYFSHQQMLHFSL